MTPTTQTQTRTTRTPTTPKALDRAIEPVAADEFLAEYWERKPLVVPRGEAGRFEDLLSTGDVERLLTETAIRTPSFRLVKAGATVDGYARDLSWRPEPFTGVADVRRVLAEFEAGATIVLQGPAPLLAPARPLLPPARGLLRPLGAGERVLHAARLAGAARPPRHARGVHAAGRGREALARLRARARAAAQDAAVPLGARRAGRAGAGRDPGRGRHALPAARLAPPGAHVRDRLAAHHRRRQRPHVAGRGAGRARRAARTTSSSGAVSTAPSRPSCRRSTGRRRRGARGDGSSGRAGRSSTASSPSCARSTAHRRHAARAPRHRHRRPRGDDGSTFEGRELEFPARLADELAFLVETEEPFTAAELPGALDEAGRLVLVRRLVREGFLRRSASAA